MRSFDLVTAKDAGSGFTSTPADIGDVSAYSVQVDFGAGATVNGVIKLQASNDQATWVDIAKSVQTIASGSPHLWNVYGAGYRFARIVWAPTSGAGAMTAKVILKEPLNRQ